MLKLHITVSCRCVVCDAQQGCHLLSVKLSFSIFCPTRISKFTDSLLSVQSIVSYIYPSCPSSMNSTHDEENSYSANVFICVMIMVLGVMRMAKIILSAIHFLCLLQSNSVVVYIRYLIPILIIIVVCENTCKTLFRATRPMS